MKTLQLIDGDLAFKNGDFQFLEGNEEVIQCLDIILGTNKGEWFFNSELGIQYGNIRDKATDSDIENEIIEGLSQEDRVTLIEEIQIIRDKSSRKATVSYKANLESGDSIENEVTV